MLHDKLGAAVASEGIILQPRVIRPKSCNPSSICCSSIDRLNLPVQLFPMLGTVDVRGQVQVPGHVGLRVSVLVGSGLVPLITGQPLWVGVGLDLEELLTMRLPFCSTLQK